MWIKKRKKFKSTYHISVCTTIIQYSVNLKWTRSRSFCTTAQLYIWIKARRFMHQVSMIITYTLSYLESANFMMLIQDSSMVKLLTLDGRLVKRSCSKKMLKTRLHSLCVMKYAKLHLMHVYWQLKRKTWHRLRNLYMRKEIKRNSLNLKLFLEAIIWLRNNGINESFNKTYLCRIEQNLRF